MTSSLPSISDVRKRQRESIARLQQQHREAIAKLRAAHKRALERLRQARAAQKARVAAAKKAAKKRAAKKRASSRAPAKRRATSKQTTKRDSRARNSAAAHDRKKVKGMKTAKSFLDTDKASIMLAFRRNDTGGNYVSLYALRTDSGIPHDRFDEAINQLRRDRVLTLDSADGRHGRIPASVLAAGITEEGKVLVYAARR